LISTFGHEFDTGKKRQTKRTPSDDDKKVVQTFELLPVNLL
jgi:hypothetical protein